MSTERAVSPTAAPDSRQLAMRRVDVETLGDQIRQFVVGDEIVAIEEAGRTLGYVVPAKSAAAPAARRARARLERAITEACAAGVFTP